MGDLTEIWVVAVSSGVAVGLMGLFAGWFLRYRSLRWQLGVVGAVTTLTVLLGVQVISRRMLISDHDRSVVLIVTSAAAVVSPTFPDARVRAVDKPLSEALDRVTEATRSGKGHT